MALFDVTLPGDAISVADNATRETVFSIGPDSLLVTDSVQIALINTLFFSNVRALTSTRIRADFENNVIINSALIDPASYQIAPISGGAAIVVPQEVFLPVGQDNPAYVEIEVTEMTDSAIYSCAMIGAIESVDGEPAGSTPSFFAGIGEAPSVLLVLAVDKNTAQIQFTEQMEDNAAIRDVDNYSFDGGLAVTSVESVQGSIITIKTTDQTEGQLYNLTIRGILAASIANQVLAVDQVQAVIS